MVFLPGLNSAPNPSESTTSNALLVALLEWPILYHFPRFLLEYLSVSCPQRLPFSTTLPGVHALSVLFLLLLPAILVPFHLFWRVQGLYLEFELNFPG